MGDSKIRTSALTQSCAAFPKPCSKLFDRCRGTVLFDRCRGTVCAGTNVKQCRASWPMFLVFLCNVVQILRDRTGQKDEHVAAAKNLRNKVVQRGSHLVATCGVSVACVGPDNLLWKPLVSLGEPRLCFFKPRFGGPTFSLFSSVASSTSFSCENLLATPNTGTMAWRANSNFEASVQEPC